MQNHDRQTRRIARLFVIDLVLTARWHEAAIIGLDIRIETARHVLGLGRHRIGHGLLGAMWQNISPYLSLNRRRPQPF